MLVGKKIILASISFLLLTGLGLLIMPLVLKEKNVTLIIGHRGYSSSYPENSLPAFRKACEMGFDGIELDVYETGDGMLLVHHDYSTFRMTGIKENIWDLTRETRADYPIRGDSGSETEMIPTLEEVLEQCSSYPCKIMIHLKNKSDFGYEPGPSCLSAIEALVKKYKLYDRVLVFGRKHVIRKFVGKYDLHFGLITSIETVKDLSELADWSRENGIQTVLFLSMASLDEDSRLKVRLLASKGISSGVYTVETEKELGILENLGLRYAITDYMLK